MKKEKKKANKKINKKQYKELMIIMKSISRRQKNIIKTMKTLTAFRPTVLEGIDGESELVKRTEKGTGYLVTEKKKRKRRRHNKVSLDDIKEFFHGRGYKIKDNGEKPIRILNSEGKKVFVIQRKDKSIWKVDRSADRGYKRVRLEDLM